MPNDFVEVVKHLDITPVIEAPDGLSQRRINHRPYPITPVRDIKKLRQTLTLPQITFAGKGIGRLIYQLNYSAGRNIYLSANPLSTSDNTGFSLQFIRIAIRYREGNNITRYLLNTTQSVNTMNNKILQFGGLTFTPYTGQLIKANFSIEVWQVAVFLSGTILETVYNTSLLFNPSNVDQTTVDTISPLEQVDWDALALPMPEVLPVNYIPSSQWVTN